ncbi:GrpE-like protein [Plasmodium brasilianum]|uniref:GrpE protein homolog n=2 Tax=Plasmodium (Plasmodium) TaxID=418103 RepID=A0A1D3PBT1_PLAMA|nr:GrpE protein homolog, mitochondrial, putative [Plasmodium malariae]KAI4838368.1 GrpE-like protein [Plasmodium brasilianum]SCN12766.1 GrpE protein homolog, mitochondrial, putative [Plasmodium malariae]
MQSAPLFRRNYINFWKNDKCEKFMKQRYFTSASTMSDKTCSSSKEEGNNKKEKKKVGKFNEKKNDNSGEKEDDKENMLNESENFEKEDEGKKEINYETYNKIDLINKIKRIKKDMEEKIVDNKILKEKYLSVLAENENLRNRYMKEIENSKLYCISNFAKSLLDVADNLALAIKNINEESLKQNEEINNIYKGIQMTETILHNIFNKYGIDKYNPINEKFNPLFHEAIFEINDSTKEKGTVATVIQQGYKIKDRILRAAKVGVVKN